MTYTDSLEGVTEAHLEGFFVGWLNPPSPEKHLQLLRAASYVMLAKDGERVVGFANAISDGVLSAYIPLVEILPEYQGQGIGTELVRQLFEKLRHLYMVDIVCDATVAPFYERFGMYTAYGMMMRNYAAQSGAVTQTKE
ncbi:GNAT family N-acetyltransferase [Anaerolineae bacterium CFX9]|nr:GNAT family N-acetyltransferase [Anaerolineae bacterium CFX9]